MPSFRAAASLVSASLFGASVGRSQTDAPPALTIEWVAPAECPGSEWLEAEALRLAKGEKVAVRRLGARAVVQKLAERRYRVVVSTLQDGFTGTRELEASSCEELASSTALILGLMIQSEIGRGDVMPPVVAKEPAPLPAPPAPPDEPPPRSTTRIWHGYAGPALGTGVGLLPGASFAVGGGVGVRFRETRLGVNGSYSPRVSAHGPSSAEGQFDLLTLGVRGCPSLVVVPFPIGFCLSADWHRMTAEGSADPARFDRYRSTVYFATLGGGGFAVVRLGGRWALPIVIEAVVPTRRPTFSFAGSGVLHQPSLVAARGTLALEYAF
jgi:hypothetical protein